MIPAWLKISWLSLLKRWEQVMEICETKLKSHPQNKRVLFTYGQAAAGAVYIDTAISQFEEILALDPQNVPSLKALGQPGRQPDRRGESARRSAVARLTSD
ncbi:hypothetical protein JYT84_00765 [bacterium AH-315-M10]|nr:hypothetical protein [bacterium AH-315-M10]